MLCYRVKQESPEVSYDDKSFRAAVAVGHKVYVFGGHPRNDDPVEDPKDPPSPHRVHHQLAVNIFNTVSLRWTTLPTVTTTREEEIPPEVPFRRSGHTAVLVGATVYVWGGEVEGGEDEGGAWLDDTLYAFDVNTHRWLSSNTEVSGSPPAARSHHSACVVGKDMYVHGGYTYLNEFTNDIYKLDTTTMVWTSINAGGTPPPGSECHSATAMGTKIFVYGGCSDQEEASNRVSVFDTLTDRWLDTTTVPSTQPLPEGHWGHSAFAHEGELYIFGDNRGAGDHANDMWKFTPETSSWKEVEPNGDDGPFWIVSPCMCMVGDEVFVFGGSPAPSPTDAETPTGEDGLYVLDLSPSLKTLCKLAVIETGLEQTFLPHDIKWELKAMTG